MEYRKVRVMYNAGFVMYKKHELGILGRRQEKIELHSVAIAAPSFPRKLTRDASLTSCMVFIIAGHASASQS